MKKHIREGARFIGILAALTLALTAQSLFTQQPFVIRAAESWIADVRAGVAVGLLLAAMACFVVTTFGAPLEVDETPVVASGQVKGFRALGPYLAAGCYLLSLLMYLAVGENFLVRFFWLAGMVLLVASQLKPPASEPGRTVGNNSVRWEWGLVAVITAVAFGLRYWRLTEIPSNLDGDIFSVGLQVLELIRHPHPQWIGVGWSEYPLFAFNVIAWVMRLFGQNQYGLMMSSVIAGTLTIPAVYLLGREMFGRRVGLIAAALLTISYTHIQYNRVVVVEPAPLIVTLLFFFLFRGLRTQQRIWFVLAGVAMGTGLLVYYPARIGLVVAALLFGWLWLWRRSLIVGRLQNWWFLCLGALATYGPMLGFSLGNFNDFIGRANLVTLADAGVRAHLMNKYGVETLNGLMVEQVKRSFLVFHVYGDSSQLFAFQGPMVDVLTAALLVLGVGWCLARLRNPKSFTLLVWLTSVLVLGGVLTNDPPFWPHLIVVLPAVAVLGALAAERAWNGLARPMGRVGQWGIGALLVVALVYTGMHNWQAYYEQMRDNAGERVRIIRYVNSLPEGYQVRLVTTSIGWRDREFEFLARGVAGQDLAPDQLRSDPQPCRDAPIVFILTHNYVDLDPLLQARCPGGQSQQHIEPNGWLSFVSYRLGPEGIKPSVVVSSEVRVDPLVWLMMGAWALVLVLAVWLYYRFVVRRVLTKRALKRTMKLGGRPGVLPQALVPKQLPPKNILLGRLAVLPRQVIEAPRWQAWLRRVSEWTSPRLTKSRARKVAIVWGVPLAALALAYLAQSIFAVRTEDGFGVSLGWLGDWPESSRLWLGAFIYLVAMVAWMIFAPDLHATENAEPAASPALPNVAARVAAWPLLILVASLACYALAMILFSLRGESSLVQRLWAGGVILFAASALLGLRARRSAHPEAQTSPHFGWIHIAILVAILAAAFWLRFYQLDKIPSDFHGDMGSHGLIARSMALGEERLLFHDAWANLPLMTFLPAAISLKVFGNNLFGLQMTSVLGGMMSLLGFYLLVWRLFDRRRLAALATALVAINVVHLHFSRIAEYMDPWPFAIWALFLVVDGLKARRFSSLALAGLLMGLSVQMYYSGRIIVFILAAFLVYALLFQRRWVTQNQLGLGLMVLGGLVALGPDLIFFARN